MYKIKGGKPTSEDDLEEIADYIEVKAILAQTRSASIVEVIREFLRPADEIETSGIEDLEDKINERLGPISEEFAKRKLFSGNKYPFDLKFNSTVVEFEGLNNLNSYLYCYLLCATRLNMRDNRVFDTIDGTKLFEIISGLAAENYFGHKSQHIVFGTATAGTFEEKVNDMCAKIGEGGGFANHHGEPVDEQDSKLDIVSWNEFSDKMAAKLLGFGQCKTGTSWEIARWELQPNIFCKKWLRIPPIHDPIRMFFIADVAPRQKWHQRTYDAGILFDRLRIMDCIPANLNEGLYGSIKKWTESAIDFAKAS